MRGVSSMTIPRESVAPWLAATENAFSSAMNGRAIEEPSPPFSSEYWRKSETCATSRLVIK